MSRFNRYLNREDIEDAKQELALRAYQAGVTDNKYKSGMLANIKCNMLRTMSVRSRYASIDLDRDYGISLETSLSIKSLVKIINKEPEHYRNVIFNFLINGEHDNIKCRQHFKNALRSIRLKLKESV